MYHNITFGNKGEELALEFLKKLKYTILQTNWRYKKAEIDIIGIDKDILVFVEVKTRTSAAETSIQIFNDEPISVFLTIRRNGPLESVEEFTSTFDRLAGHIEHIAEHRVIPDIVVPLHQAIGI